MNINHLETQYAEQVLAQAIDYVSSYSEEEDFDAATVALLVRALEIALDKRINIENL